MTSGRFAVPMTLEDATGAPRMAVVHMTWSVDDPPLCGHLGPPPAPGQRGYACSLPASAHGVHEVWADGLRLDSWPADPVPGGE